LALRNRFHGHITARTRKRILVIGDSHHLPEEPNNRAHWLGHHVAEGQYDLVVDIGDWFDMHSLNTIDKPGSMAFEGARYWQDVDAGLDAQDRFQWELRGLGANRPDLVRTLGNHEDRINRVVSRDPKLEGLISTRDLLSKEYGWEEFPFGEHAERMGVTFCHYFPSGNMGRPISGPYAARWLALKGFGTRVQGHSHELIYYEESPTPGRRVHGVAVGCYFLHTPDWGLATAHNWRRGLCELDHVYEGTFDLHFHSIQAVYRAFAAR
jgi:hypothetical protein